tara:strand:- start:371 stop:526 length:156 start_codon:yes stop_codon:yes gene_type:complete
MSLSKIKIVKDFSNFKNTLIKTGICVSLLAYWGVILVELLSLLTKLFSNSI